VLQSVNGNERLEAVEEEPDVRGERLELLAVVRGLEALDQPARVTLITPSRYVQRGFRLGLRDWRSNGWLWERFGRRTYVRNRDLWRRIDQAMKYHRIECRRLRCALSADRSPRQPLQVNPGTGKMPLVRNFATFSAERCRKDIEQP
jgi:ribonuclease HI